MTAMIIMDEESYAIRSRITYIVRGIIMTISEKIFEILAKKKMSQKEFSEKTGIAQSSISDWKRKKTNPSADKLLKICQVLDVSPLTLLSCTTEKDSQSISSDIIVIDKKTSEGYLIEEYSKLDDSSRDRLLGYLEALRAIRKER